MPSSSMSKRAADLPEDVEERHHLALPGALDRDVALGGQRGAGPGRGLDPVRERAVGVAAEPVDTLDPDDRSVSTLMIAPIFCSTAIRSMISGSMAAFAQLGDALGADRGQQHLLGRADARVRQLELGALQPLRRREAQALGPLLDDGAELAQHVEVVVDRAGRRSGSRRGRG